MEKAIIILAIFLLVVAGCRKTAQCSRNDGQIGDTVFVVTDSSWNLPPLETGEFFYKKKDPFGETIELHGNQIVLDTFIFKPGESQMFFNGNYLIMKNLVGHRMFHVFDRNTLEYINSVGTRGNGPNEFIYPKLIKCADLSQICYVFESTNSKIFRLTDDFRIEKYKDLFMENTSSNGRWSSKQHISKIGVDDFIYVDDSKTGKSIFRTTVVGDSISTHEIFSLQLNQNLKSPFAYIGDFEVNLQKNRMVYAYKYFKMLKFMDMEGKKVRTINFERDGFEDNTIYKINGLDQNVTHYWGACAQDKYVYFLYSGRTPHEVIREGNKQNLYIYVEQYDWNGNPVRRYKLDNWGYFTIDEESNRIILVSTYFDDPFFVFQMPE